MRITTSLLCLLLTMLAGCQANNQFGDTGPDPAIPLLSLPSPAELSQNAPLTLAKKSTSQLVVIEGVDYDNSLPSFDAMMVIEMLRLGSTLGKASPAYAMYRVAGVAPGSEYTAFIADFEWIDDPPGEQDALFLGICNWERGAWAWFQCDSDTSQWQSISPSLQTHPSSDDYLAIVSYAESDCQISKLSLSIDNPTAEDPWLYYTLETDTTSSIYRSRIPGGDTELVLEGTDTVSYMAPHIRVVGAEKQLAFSRLEDEGKWEIWRSGLDGSAAQRLSWSETSHRVPCGWAPDGASFYFRDWSNHELYVRDVITPKTGLLARSSDTIFEACWDYSGNKEYNTLVVYEDSGPSGSVHCIGYIWADGPPPVEIAPVEVLADLWMGSDYVNPSSYRISDGRGGYTYGFVYCMGDSGANFKIADFRGRSNTSGEEHSLLSDIARKLGYPVVSPDGTWLAYSEETYEVGAENTLYVDDFLTMSDDTRVVIAERVTGKPCWYDPNS